MHAEHGRCIFIYSLQFLINGSTITKMSGPMHIWWWVTGYMYVYMQRGYLYVPVDISIRMGVLWSFEALRGFQISVRGLKEFRSHACSAKQVCKFCIWVTNLGTIHGEVLPNCFCLYRPSKLRHLFTGDLPSDNTTQNQPKSSCKPAAFRQILQFPCD